MPPVYGPRFQQGRLKEPISALRIDAGHWRRRATELRAFAEQMRYDEPRREMLRLAAECAALAERPERPK